ncbi:secreted RxLR effector protein 161-like [Ziziphus jujuba]|uniref:Secreted RxLR effector protein 161-like n=1 Tax=Ziziphus jujuba TaxID=326968 RepID=A0ABM4A2D9_ZIZJJ|nr:secreted RxLR effector protein 161-like [Ziziphus jujuba]
MKWLLWYLTHSVSEGLSYKGNSSEIELIGYVDSDYAGDRDRRRSTSSYVFTLGGNCISWKFQLQPVVALTTTESEYMVATEATKEAIWLKGLLTEFKALNQEAILYSDSQSAIHLCKNPVFHERSKHIQVLTVSKFNTCKNLLQVGAETGAKSGAESVLSVLKL